MFYRINFINFEYFIINENNHVDMLRFIQACNVFGINIIPMKLAMAFVLSRLLKINDEESWGKYIYISKSMQI